MKILFIHRSFPGQFGALAAELARRPGWQIAFVHEAGRRYDHLIPEGGQQIIRAEYAFDRVGRSSLPEPLARFHNGIRTGEAAYQALKNLRQNGFIPDLIYAHPGWGGDIHVSDVFPEAKLVLYAEYFYRNAGSDVGFDPEFPVSEPERLRVRPQNAHALLNMVEADALITATAWQRDQFPGTLRQKISVLHEGVDTQELDPEGPCRLELTDQGLILSPEIPVVTFSARSLEPVRGFHSFMRALPAIQEALPEAHAVILGREAPSYGPPPQGEVSWKSKMLKELSGRLDLSRVHFLGEVPKSAFVAVLRLSRAHVYLTYPFILSWSLIEAMALGCALVASDTPPVREVLTHGRTARLVDFFADQQIAQEAIRLLRDPACSVEMRRQARNLAIEKYDRTSVCLPRQIQYIDSLLSGLKTGD